MLMTALLCLPVPDSTAQQTAVLKKLDYTLGPENLAVVINDDDPNSVEVGEYYRLAHNIPERNMVHVHIEGSPRKLTLSAFNHLRYDIETQLPTKIWALLLVWTAPYAVECNSITSALTLGFDSRQCQNTCAVGKLNPYFDSVSVNPQSDPGLRLAMLLPTESVNMARALIDRGVLAKHITAPASAYLLSTSDKARNVRAQFYPPSGVFPQKRLAIKSLHTEYIENVSDVMFYSTGLTFVPKLETLHFLPGALADHLTSAGGDLLGREQMSSVRWLDAGATASYGAVSEPCNYPQKFPQPGVLMKHYLSGASAIEAYWASVAWPMQGIFIGDPLAAPYR